MGAGNVGWSSFNTPTAYLNNVIEVPTGVFTDAAGNTNEPGIAFTWASSRVSITISSPDVTCGGTTNNQTITLYFSPNQYLNVANSQSWVGNQLLIDDDTTENGDFHPVYTEWVNATATTPAQWIIPADLTQTYGTRYTAQFRATSANTISSIYIKYSNIADVNGMWGNESITFSWTWTN